MPDAEEHPEEQELPGEVAEPEDEEEVDGEITPGTSQPSRRLIAETKAFSGPLPRPPVLGEYEEVKPGLAETIVQQWTKETAHRHKTIDSIRDTDRESMRRYYAGERFGQIIGLLAFFGLLGVAVFAIHEGSNAGAIASLVVAGSYAVWALRRHSAGSGPPSVDLDDGDEIETLTDAKESESKPE